MSRVATATATVPQPCRVLGTSLRPFCLGHHLLFKRLGLPFAGNHEADAGPDDLMIGIAVCAGSSYEATLDSLLDGTWENIFKRWCRQVSWLWYHRRKVNMMRAERSFREYLRTGYEEPPVWKYGASGINLSAPWETLLKCRLVVGGFAETEVLNGYLPARWYDYFTMIELQQAENLSDKKNWKAIFHTQRNADAMERAKKGNAE